MTLTELVTAVQTVVMESSLDSDDIAAIINRGVLEIAGGGDRPHGLPKLAPLPQLVSSGTVAVTSQNTSMPSTFHRGLFLVFDASGNELKRYDFLTEFLRDAAEYPGTGAPEAFCLVGNSLFCYPVPSSATLTLHFYRLPVDMADDADEVDGIPEHFQHKLLVNFAAREIFNLVEQGLEGNTPGTLKHNALYQSAIMDFEREIGPEDTEPQYIYDEGDYL